MKMKTKIPASVALIAGLLVVGSPLFAHHGDAAYAAAPLVLKGCVVTEFDWMNPHSLIKFDYKTETGAVQHWTMEIGSPPSMTLLGCPPVGVVKLGLSAVHENRLLTPRLSIAFWSCGSFSASTRWQSSS